MTFESYRRDRQRLAASAAREFAANPELQWLVLRGGVGTGKTHLLVAIAHFLLAKRRPLYFVAPDLMDYLKAGMEEIDDLNETTIARTANIKKADVLLIDDLGAENATKWTDERFYQIIDYRYRCRLPLVVATNLAEDRMPPRLASRLHDAARARVITMDPGDYRRSDERADELAGLLDQLEMMPRLSAAAD